VLARLAVSIVDLDLNPLRNHGICMPNPDQVSGPSQPPRASPLRRQCTMHAATARWPRLAVSSRELMHPAQPQPHRCFAQTFLLWMEGDLVAQGGNGCDMDFVGSDLQTPECSYDTWLAIQAVDSEATSLGGHSKGGIKAAMQWCGQDVYTDDTWECSTVAEEGWQNPIADGYDPRMEFDDAVPTYNADLTCRHRELPSCSWVRRNTNVVSARESVPDCSSFNLPNPNQSLFRISCRQLFSHFWRWARSVHRVRHDGRCGRRTVQGGGAAGGLRLAQFCRYLLGPLFWLSSRRC
jgi:hypothetical protein